MWIYTPTSFVSLVAHRDRPGFIMARGRLPGDLQRVFPGCKVEATPAADYRFRTVVSQADAAAAIARQVDSIDYDNVKNAIPKAQQQLGDPLNSDLRYRAMTRAWSGMMDAQEDAAAGESVASKSYPTAGVFGRGII